MKYLSKLLFISIALYFFSALSSCDEEEFLKEVPLSFYTPENSFVTYDDYESATINIYSKIRMLVSEGYGRNDFGQHIVGMTELAYPHSELYGPDYDLASILLPTSNEVYEVLWRPAYEMIYDANVIIERVNSEFSKLTESQKNKIKAEAIFIRGWCYKMLANLYGGVPLVLEEIKGPKRDYIRASRQEVYQQSALDLEFAINHLPDIDEIEVSRANKLVAYHILSEVYISMGRWQDAINAASVVIDHPATSLMTERFGSRINDPGDVYWDLFRVGNQVRSIGNTESLWIVLERFDVAGGGSGANGVRFTPRLWQIRVRNNDQSWVNLVPLPNDYLYGRGGGASKPSPYFFGALWHKSGYNQDIRNSEFNIVRDIKVNNPASDYNGKWLFKDNVPMSYSTFADTTRNWWPVLAKLSTPGRFPKAYYNANQNVPGSLIASATLEWKDRYVYRLAETYLLRAEAYLGNNDKIKAAEDINVLRRRAYAPEVDPSLVDIDYILDERMRELYYEEPYLLTLARLGKTVERTRKYHPKTGYSYQDHHNLWPIPYKEIEKNTGATLEQNPGY